MKKLAISIILILIFVTMTACSMLPKGKLYKDDSSYLEETPIVTSKPKKATKPSKTSLPKEEAQEKNNIQSIFSNDILYDDFVKASKQIKLDINKIREFEQGEDWAQGSRFTFSYKNKTFYLYTNIDSVESINTSNRNGTKVYHRGFEPYLIDDYIMDIDEATLLMHAEDTIKSLLNYPSSARFSIMKWAFGREGDLYYVQSNVKAKNAFGVINDMPFTVIFQKDASEAIYVKLGGRVHINNLPEKAQRAKIEKSEDTPVETNDSNKILIKDAVANKYSQEKVIDGETYYKYHVPAGKYSVTARSKNAMVWIVNPDNQVDSSITLSYEEVGEITLEEGQFIEVTFGTEVLLSKTQ